MKIRSSENWEATAKHYEALWRSALSAQSMCADNVKGYVDVSFSWDDGKADTRTYMMWTTPSAFYPTLRTRLYSTR